MMGMIDRVQAEEDVGREAEVEEDEEVEGIMAQHAVKHKVCNLGPTLSPSCFPFDRGRFPTPLIGYRATL